MKNIFLFCFLMALFFSHKDLKAQENKSDYLNQMIAGLPDIYKRSSANLFFTIQVGAFSKENKELEKVTNIVITKENDYLFIYRLGEFPTYKDALEFKKIVLNVCNDAFIVPIKNGERIHLREVVKE